MRQGLVLLICVAVWCLGAGVSLALAVVRLDAGWVGQSEQAGTVAADWARVLPGGTPVALPHCWASDLRVRDACAFWYARDIAFPPALDGRGAWLLADDVAGDLEVYLDGARVATLNGYGLPHRVRLPGGPGTHHLALRLSLPAGAGGTGLGALALQAIVPASLDALMPEGDADAGRVSVRFRLLAEAPVRAMLVLELYAPDRKRAIAKTAVPFDLGAGSHVALAEWPHLTLLQPWQPTAPRLYRVRATLLAGGVEADWREVSFGLTRYALAEDGWRLNGKPLGLKGLRVPGGACAVLAGDAATALESVRRAGFTALMADDLAFSRRVLDAADRLGMLVMVHIPAGADAASHVLALGAHPSVAGWTWGDTGDAGMVAAVRQWDPVRPILVREGARGVLYLPGLEPREVALADGAARRDGDAAPVLAPGLTPATPAVCPLSPTICGDGRLTYTGEDRELAELRMLVERVRRANCPLGYFLHPFPGEGGFGLFTATGAPTKFHTAVLAMNAPVLMTLRLDGETYVGQPPAVEATIVNDAGRAQALVLYRVVTTPEPSSQTIIARRDDFALTGARLQPIPRTAFPFQATERPGVYRVQYVLSDRGRVVSSAHVAVVVREAPP
jgi:hypothetical protein